MENIWKHIPHIISNFLYSLNSTLWTAFWITITFFIVAFIFYWFTTNPLLRDSLLLLDYLLNNPVQNKEILKYYLLDVQSNSYHQMWPNINSITNSNNRKIIGKEHIEKLILQLGRESGSCRCFLFYFVMFLL